MEQKLNRQVLTQDASRLVAKMQAEKTPARMLGGRKVVSVARIAATGSRD